LLKIIDNGMQINSPYNFKAAAHVACRPSVLVHCKPEKKKKEFDYLDRPAIEIGGFTALNINFVFLFKIISGPGNISM